MNKLDLQKIIREEVKKALKENYRDAKENVDIIYDAMLKKGGIAGMREATATKDDLDKIGDFVMSLPQFERFNPSQLKSAIKDMHSEWKKVAAHYKSIEEYFEEMEEMGDDQFMEGKKPSKKKKSLKEGYAWERGERKFGEPLPTLASIQKAHQAKYNITEEAQTSLMRSHPGMVEEIIEMLKHIDVDGETMEYILKAVGMEEQMQHQLTPGGIR